MMPDIDRHLKPWNWAAAVLLLLASQLIFWGAVGYVESAARPRGMEMLPHVTYTFYNKQGDTLGPSGALRAARVGYSGYRGKGDAAAHYALFNILFHVADKSEPQALFLENRENLSEVSLNGVPIQPDKIIRLRQGDSSIETALYPLPSRFLQQGVNVLFMKTPDVRENVALSPFAVGASSALEPAYRARSLLQSDVPIAGVAILLFTIALCLVVNWPPEDRPRLRWLIAFLTANALATLSVNLWAGTASLPGFAVLEVAINLFLGVSACRYVMLDTGCTNGWASLAIAMVGGLAITAAIVISVPAGGAGIASSDPTLNLSDCFAATMALAAMLLLLRQLAGSGSERWLERLVLVLCLTAVAVDRLSGIADLFVPFGSFWPIALRWLPIAGPLLGAGMVLLIARQAGEARREVIRANEILAARLDEQDAALSRSYDAQKQMLQRQVVLEERQRIVRDMHDGIGGQLLGLMLQVRSGGVDKVEVEQGLQSSIADLRLIVDSMDSAEDGLAATLLSFEHRVRAQVEAAGLDFQVEHGLSEAEPGPGPRPTLQILRILQEAVTNALRHSGGDLIRVSSGYDADGFIAICVDDNGQGLPGDIKGGRGLTNMRTRAQGLGGHLGICANGIGTQIRLVIPQQAGTGFSDVPTRLS